MAYLGVKGDVEVTAKGELADSHERLWEKYQKLTNELMEANQTIARLTVGKGLEAVAATGPNGNPIGPKMVIGVVQCPRCGQYMEVEK